MMEIPLRRCSSCREIKELPIYFSPASSVCRGCLLKKRKKKSSTGFDPSCAWGRKRARKKSIIYDDP